jgi:predicted O-linked N-acetylglucosamine transferase (SPINDLY family)
MTSAVVQKSLLEAQALHQRGELAAAEALYGEVLAREPAHPKALHLLGVVALQQGRAEAAARLIARAVLGNGADASAHFDLGCALLALKRSSEAVASFESALRLRPNYPQAYCNRGTALLALERPADALASFDRALALRADYPEALHNRGNALMALRRTAQALEAYEAALKLRPQQLEIWNSFGTALARAGRLEEALEALGRVLAAAPRHVGALLNRGNVLLELDRPDEARECLERARLEAPNDPQVCNSLGYALFLEKRTEEAVASFDRALALRPSFAAAFANRGSALAALNDLDGAMASFAQALQHDPRDPDAWALRAPVLLELRRPDEALESCAQALALDANHALAWSNRAAVFWDRTQFDQAAESLARLVAVKPTFNYAIGALFNARMYCCDWQDFAGQLEKVSNDVLAGTRACVPFSFLLASDDAAAQRRCAEVFAADKYPPAPAALCASRSYSHERLRVAYLSADLRTHPVAHLIAELFERHDRERFEVTGVYFGPRTDDAMHRRLRGAFEHFVDVRDRSDRAVAQLLREREIDVAIDLMGYTQASRMGIFAHRPAPIQVSFLGYAGTSGAPYIDYLIADAEVIPPQQRAHYSEAIAYLPDCFQPNDGARPIDARTPSRAQLGLPETGFVFCCFNNSYKITPPVFERWMGLLRETPGSVLWLREASATATGNLWEAARRHGVDSARLVFAPRTAQLSEHLARQRAADLFLDTFPYNAHTTASDALWAGLPVLTCRGESFVARVAASLLKSIGLPELVTDSLDAYTARALELARNPEELRALRGRLEHNRLTTPLFDSRRFCRHFETALLEMHRRYQLGLAPIDFAAGLDAQPPRARR